MYVKFRSAGLGAVFETCGHCVRFFGTTTPRSRGLLESHIVTLLLNSEDAAFQARRCSRKEVVVTDNCDRAQKCRE